MPSRESRLFQKPPPPISGGDPQPSPLIISGPVRSRARGPAEPLASHSILLRARSTAFVRRREVSSRSEPPGDPPRLQYCCNHVLLIHGDPPPQPPGHNSDCRHPNPGAGRRWTPDVRHRTSIQGTGGSVCPVPVLTVKGSSRFVSFLRHRACRGSCFSIETPVR